MAPYNFCHHCTRHSPGCQANCLGYLLDSALRDMEREERQRQDALSRFPGEVKARGKAYDRTYKRQRRKARP